MERGQGAGFGGRFGHWVPWAGAPGNDAISIAELVRNGTLSADVAAVLWAAAEAQVSFLTVAMPQGAGKTTVASAVLALRKPDVPLHFIYGRPQELEELKRERRGGYIVVGEFSRAPMPSYIWGESVRRVFETLPAGYSLQTSLHAPGVEPAIRAVTEANAVPDDLASAVKLIVYIEVFRTSAGAIARRVVEVYEMHLVENGKPIGHPLFLWRKEDDSYERVTGPHQFGRDADDLERRSAVIAGLAESGKTSPADVAEAVAAYREASG
jgi:hypothetical protein